MLDKELDWDNEGVDKDLNEIADEMIDWEEKRLDTLLELSRPQIHDIKHTNLDRPILQRYVCMVKCVQRLVHISLIYFLRLEKIMISS